MTPALGFAPEVGFVGPVDILSDPTLTRRRRRGRARGADNVARHAAASRCEVAVTGTTDRMTVTVTDDGVGLGETGRRSGLDNIRLRAEQRSGRLTIQDAAPGTRLTWSASVA